MPILQKEVFYNGAERKIERLGLEDLVQQVRDALSGFRLELLEVRNANGGAVVREMVDQAIASVGGWTNRVSGDVDWRKCRETDGVKLCVGVEVQISARSDLLVIDVIHLRNALEKGDIDVAVIVVPSDRLATFLPSRAPSLSDARRHVVDARADSLPILLMPFEHDGPGEALPKKRTRQGRLPGTVAPIVSDPDSEATDDDIETA
jgi:hypothetical protein